jgi:hypothetical protein
LAEEHPATEASGQPGCLATARRLAIVAIIVYLLLGILTTLVFVFLGPGNVGTRALGEPQTYLICTLWPLALWEYARLMLGLG